MLGHEIRQLLGNEQQGRFLGCAAAGGHQRTEPLGAAAEQCQQSERLGLHEQPLTVCLAGLDQPDAIGLGFGQRPHSLAFHLGGHHDVSVLRGLVAFCSHSLGFSFGQERFLFCRGLADAFGGVGGTFGLGFLLAPLARRLGNHDVRFVLAFGRCGVGLCHPDALLALRLGGTDVAVALLLGHLDLRLADGAGRSLATESVDVAGLIGDVLDVDVDQAQPDLAQFELERFGDVGDELLAVGVDLLDRHRGDHHAHLAEDDVASQVLDVQQRQAQQAFRGVLHDTGLGGDADGERRRSIDPDVLLGERPLEFDLDGDRRQIQVRVTLHDGPHHGAAAVQAPRRLAFPADASIDHEDAVGRAALEAR